MSTPVLAPECVASLRAALASQGYAYLSAFSPDRTGLALLALAGSFGSVYLPPDVDPAHPVLESHPAADASLLAPFDRPEAIGWHNDFSTHADRPALSLAYLARPDPLGPEHGAWRVASCDRVLDQLRATRDGREVIRFLRETDLPYSFTGDGAPSFFRALEPRGSPPGRLGMRLYGRAMRDGARLAYGTIPEEIERAVKAVEGAANQVGHVLAAPAGALLVTDNWHSLHDRLPQCVDPKLSLRCSLLCFVEALHQPLALPNP
ncbi:TauD/TfdA family dioxygenase [Sorangium sp. So ce542]|uniref:TauD/TfdA family dioxygenase n=1 Tax=Sorangium sp. So ce542 TaxID=3133316 RepID=UPI003F61DB32